LNYYFTTYFLGDTEIAFWSRRPTLEEVLEREEREKDPNYVTYPEEMPIQEELQERWKRFMGHFDDRESSIDYVATRINEVLFHYVPRMREWWIRRFSNRSPAVPEMLPGGSMEYELLGSMKEWQDERLTLILDPSFIVKEIHGPSDSVMGRPSQEIFFEVS
jgi:hypothetical protein